MLADRAEDFRLRNRVNACDCATPLRDLSSPGARYVATAAGDRLLKAREITIAPACVNALGDSSS